MIFQKKIIIGSIFSIIATVLGVVAVFFPDLLNLQKSKIEKEVVTLSTLKDAENFSEWLKNHKQGTEIFELDLVVCTPMEGNNFEFIDKPDGKDGVYFYYNGSDKDDLESHPAFNITGSSQFGLISYRYGTNGRCGNEDNNYGISGYFLLTGFDFLQGVDEVTIKGIPIEQVQLKNY